MAGKQGCPRCGKPTAGTPTPDGFKWMHCEECTNILKAKEGKGGKDSDDGDADGGKS